MAFHPIIKCPRGCHRKGQERRNMKHEKYITEKKTKTGHYLNVSIFYAGEGKKRNHFSKNVNVAEYPSAADAMAAAVMIRDQAIKDIQKGPTIRHSPTVDELYKQTASLFNSSLKTKRRHDESYEHCIKKYGSVPITDIKASDIQESINYSINNYSLDATQKSLAVWRQIYRVAAMLEIPVADKTLSIVIPKDRKPKETAEKKPVTISEEDFMKYMSFLEKSLKYTRDKTGMHRKKRIIYALYVMWYTGMRPSEAFALNKSDFNIAGRFISVSKAVGSTGSEMRQIVATKTVNSIRIIPICDELMPIVEKMLQDLPDEHLFYDADGLPFEISTLSTFVFHTAKRAGVKFNMYMCRHSMSTSLIQANVAPRTVQDILGHASFGQSLDYARSSEAEREEALNNRKV